MYFAWGITRSYRSGPRPALVGARPRITRLREFLRKQSSLKNGSDFLWACRGRRPLSRPADYVSMIIRPVGVTARLTIGGVDLRCGGGRVAGKTCRWHVSSCRQSQKLCRQRGCSLLQRTRFRETLARLQAERSFFRGACPRKKRI